MAPGSPPRVRPVRSRTQKVLRAAGLRPAVLTPQRAAGLCPAGLAPQRAAGLCPARLAPQRAAGGVLGPSGQARSLAVRGRSVLLVCMCTLLLPQSNAYCQHKGRNIRPSAAVHPVAGTDVDPNTFDFFCPNTKPPTGVHLLLHAYVTPDALVLFFVPAHKYHRLREPAGHARRGRSRFLYQLIRTTLCEGRSRAGKHDVRHGVPGIQAIAAGTARATARGMRGGACTGCRSLAGLMTTPNHAVGAAARAVCGRLPLPGGYGGQGTIELRHQFLLVAVCKRAAEESFDSLGEKPLPALLF